MKIGDLVRYKPEYMFNSVGVIVSVGYGEHYTDTEQSPALHPDVWVLTTYGEKERWNEMNLEVINETG